MTTNTSEKAVPNTVTPELALAGLGALAVATLAGCGGGGGEGGGGASASGGGEPEAVVVAANTITGITIREVNDAVVTIDGSANSAVSLADPGP